MTNSYDFLNLSYVEFEEVCHDLLQNDLKIPLQTYAVGKDRGIDLRAYTDEGHQVIIQCKRYADYKSLTKAMKLEIPKLAKLGKFRYILATSVKLTEAQHRKLEKQLEQYITSPNDIIANKNLNALLRKFPHVEQSHFKLWIQSTTVLQTILHSKVINYSSFEFQTINDLIKYYVINPSFHNAMKILSENCFVVISGIPGIGKTTLARIIAFHYLSKLNYSQFVFLSGSIDEGVEIFNESARQVFLFDDFLGRSFDERKLDRNEDKKIIAFIEKIKRSRNKVLLFTTREYILRNVQQQHDLLDSSHLEFSKCVIDLHTYTISIKARILYQHLFFSGLSGNYLQLFADPKIYNTVIKHKNYNPRLIDDSIKIEKGIPTSPNAFIQTLLKNLDNPKAIWEAPFTKQITEPSRWILTVLLTMGAPVMWVDLVDASKQFFTNNYESFSILFSEALFESSYKELESSFLISNLDDEGHLIIQYQNPSVQDFLLQYFEENQDLLVHIIRAASYVEQLFHIFTSKRRAVSYLDETKPITPKDELNRARIEKVVNGHKALKNCSLQQYRKHDSGVVYYARNRVTYYNFLRLLSDAFIDTKFNSSIEPFIVKRLQELIYIKEDRYGSGFNDYLYLLKTYKHELNLNPDIVIENYSESMKFLYMFEYYFKNIAEVFPDEYNKFILKNDFKKKILNLIKLEMAAVDDDYLNTLIGHIEAARDLYKLPVSRQLKALEKRFFDVYGPHEVQDGGSSSRSPDAEKAETDIQSMFASLNSI